MKEGEVQAERFLKARGFTNIRYEPCPNQTPDFLINNDIAVEVRLVEKHHPNGSKRGYESSRQIQRPLSRFLDKYLKKLGPRPADECTWYFSYWFKRPLDIRKLERHLDAVLLPFVASRNKQPFDHKISDNFRFSVKRAHTEHANLFVRGLVADHQAQGFPACDLVDSLKIAIEEKSEKISSVKDDYRYWWLILVDSIGYADTDLEYVEMPPPGLFDRVTLIHPFDAEISQQIHPLPEGQKFPSSSRVFRPIRAQAEYFFFSNTPAPPEADERCENKAR
ncbi:MULTISPECIES: hypothetical protein [unclassified Chelatococcus]|uniref:hypothetical protein n=1 Tax=unclassified Chelatococcus TaxID=2638111 RepID=UPI001BD0D956|nr:MULTISPECIES: hypothetical protein [unclassified Chelatococcus]MBS7701482.1 hypothetical protein [Chelatococcus sp. YT9]MBX3559212.1 hypothetical protein [Chelatococcus sp.]